MKNHPDTGHDWDESTIKAHILEVANKMPVFKRGDLVDAHFRVHHSDGWDEGLETLVAEGKLFIKESQSEKHGQSLFLAGGTVNLNEYSLLPFS